MHKYVFFLYCVVTLSCCADDVRVGLIGLDTSHATAFTKLLNGTNRPAAYAGFRVNVIYPQGSRDIASSTNRVPKYLEEVKPFGPEIVDSIDALVQKCDVVLLESNDGRVHLEQAVPVFKAGKRLFIDKPIAASLVDCLVLFQLSQHYKVPMFSVSSLRYMGKAQAIRAGVYGPVSGATTYSPCTIEPTHPDLMWYGIHGVELLFTLMGTGCQSVQRQVGPDSDVTVGTWQDGRIGTFVAKKTYAGEAVTRDGTIEVGKFDGYEKLLKEILVFFKTGTPPVPADETIAMFVFMEAAQQSKNQGGARVDCAGVLQTARQQAALKFQSLIQGKTGEAR